MDISILKNSVILIDKQTGKTSFEIIEEVRRLLNTKKVGHSGTLDKFASGLLVICTGIVTKLSTFFIEENKSYLGDIQLGITTETDDLDGKTIKTKSITDLKEETIYKSLDKFKGEIFQVPPTYSAKKIRGKRASDLARRGKSFELSENKVFVHDMSLKNIDLSNGTFSLQVNCSKGTYIRSIARDLGEDLGVGAHLIKLRRLSSGGFKIENAVTTLELRDYINGKKIDKKFYYRPDEALVDHSIMTVNDHAARYVLHGSYFNRKDILNIEEKEKKRYIILDENKNLIAIADIDIQKWIINYINVFC